MSNDSVKPNGRRTYRKPELKAYGHVLALTAGGTATGNENNMGAMP